MIHLHKYTLRAAEPYWDTSWGGKAQYTKVYRMCVKCNKPKVENIQGWWVTGVGHEGLTLYPHLG